MGACGGGGVGLGGGWGEAVVVGKLVVVSGDVWAVVACVCF